jgi:hypothetical protein
VGYSIWLWSARQHVARYGAFTLFMRASGLRLVVKVLGGDQSRVLMARVEVEGTYMVTM